MMKTQKRLPTPMSRRYLLLLPTLLIGILALFMSVPNGTALMQSGTIGYQDFQFGSSCQQKPTGEKAQSKVWWTDNSWWGVLCGPNSDQRIYRLNLGTQTWQDTGVQVETRTNTRTEVMWDPGPAKLYVLTHQFSESGATGSQPVNLYRFSYNAGSDTYNLDSGFPTVVATGRPEVIVIAKDSTGQLWVAYVVGSKVMVNRSTTNEQTWGTPFILPVDSVASSVTSDDIATIIAFQGKIGVMWSDQGDDKFYFSIHQDSAGDQTWQPVESAWQQSGNISDDHLSIQADSTGRIFVAAKTSLSGSSPLNVMLTRQTNGQWSTAVFGTGSQNHTRPILVLDESNNLVHMFATLGGSGCCIVHKTSSLNNPSFPSGNGTIVIDSDTSNKINNVQSTDNGVTNASGLLLIASDHEDRLYFHAYLPIGGGGPTNTPTNTFTPTNTSTQGPSPTFTNTPTNTPTATSTLPPGPQTSFSPIDDAHVKNDSPTSNYGSVTHVRTRGVSNPIYNSYLKFNVNGLPGAVTRATLRLFAYDGSNHGGSVYSVSNNFLNSGSPWTEGALNWNNAPTIGGSPLSTVNGTIPNNTWVEYDVTSAITGNGTFSFALSSTTTNSMLMNSSEAATNQPELIIETGGTAFTPTNTYTATNTPTQGPSATFTNTPTASNTPTPTFTPGPQSNFNPTDDAHVKADSPNNNYGSQDNLRTRGVANPIYNAYLKFTVTGLSGPATSATLRLFSYDGSNSGGSIYLVSNNYQDNSGPWTESNLRWNNAPIISGSPLDTVSGTIPNNTWVEYDVTSAISGNGTYSFAISSTTTNSLFFNSSEAADNLPVLVIGGGGANPGTIPATATPSNTPTITHTPSPTIIPGPETIVTPVDDAHIKSSSPTNNYGSITHLRTRSAADTSYITYLKFDVSGLAGAVTGASLQLFAYDGSNDGGSVYWVSNDYLDGSGPWTETGLIWNNAPSIGGSPLDTVSGTIPDDSWVTYDVTSAIIGDGTYSFAVTSTTTNSMMFNSSEAVDNRPVLVIETDGGANLVLGDTSALRGTVRTQSLNAVPLFTGSSICADGALQFTITNQGDPMTAAASYSVFGPEGELPSGTFGPLDIDASATITIPAGTTAGTYTLFAGVDGLVIAAECAAPVVEPTVTPSLTATEESIATEEVIVPPTEPPTPLPTFTWIPAPTQQPTATDLPPTATLEPTPTPLPLGLPFIDTLDNGSASWTVSAGWTLEDAARIGGTGGFWYAGSNAASVETLTLSVPLDLRTAGSPMLRFDSVLGATHSIASVEVSTDGVTWQPVFAVQPSASWQSMYVHLWQYQQQTIWIRWVRLVQDPTDEQPADFWMIDNVAVADVSLLQPSPTPTSTVTTVPTSEPTPAPTETPVATEAVEPEGAPIPAEATPEVTEAAAP